MNLQTLTIWHKLLFKRIKSGKFWGLLFNNFIRRKTIFMVLQMKTTFACLDWLGLKLIFQ